jgi:hypothetical protein
VQRLAAIQPRLDILLRDAREIRAALTRLSDRAPFAVLRPRGLARQAHVVFEAFAEGRLARQLRDPLHLDPPRIVVK